MPTDARNLDFLRQHARMQQRVSNLETGVHPLFANLDYYDSIDWTSVPTFNGWARHETFPWAWHKRFGICTMRGGLDGSGGKYAGLSGGEKVGEVPNEQAPAFDTELQIITPFDAPYRGRAVLQADGDVILYNPYDVAAAYICFDAVTWVTG